MIRISDDLWVAADQVASVKTDSHYDKVRISLKTGETHVIGHDYGQSIWTTADRIVKAIEKETQCSGN